MLAGSIATLLSWAKPLAGSDGGGAPAGFLPEGSAPLPMLAAYTGCQLTRRFSAAAFARHRRAMTAPDLIEAIGPVFEEFSPAD